MVKGTKVGAFSESMSINRDVNQDGKRAGKRAGVRSNIPTFRNILQHFVGENGIKWNPAGLGSV